MSADYSENKERLAQLMKSKKPDTPMQEVRPVEPAPAAKPEKAEVHVNFWIDADLMDEVKLHALRSKKTIKQVGREALELYLKTNAE